jgi:hypothetical protein
MFRLWVSAETLIGLLKERTMNDKEINRAIAEHLGWRWFDHPDTRERTKTFTLSDKWVLNPAGELVFPHSVPNYCGDLNAMHEAEEAAFGSSNLWAAFLFKLLDAVGASGMPSLDGMTCLLQATARQRSEAFLRVVGKWKGEE